MNGNAQKDRVRGKDGWTDRNGELCFAWGVWNGRNDEIMQSILLHAGHADRWQKATSREPFATQIKMEVQLCISDKSTFKLCLEGP